MLYVKKQRGYYVMAVEMQGTRLSLHENYDPSVRNVTRKGKVNFTYEFEVKLRGYHP